MQKSISGNFVGVYSQVDTNGNMLGAASAAALSQIINVSASGSTTLLVAVAGQSHKVQGLRLSVAGPVIISLLDGVTLLERFNYSGAGGGILLDLRDKPYWTGSVNTALNLSLSTVVQVDGRLDYITS
jgi:hypothetical protein